MELIRGYEDIRNNTITGEWTISVSERNMMLMQDVNDYHAKKEKHDSINQFDENIDKYIEVSKILSGSYFQCLYNRWVREILHCPVLDVNSSFDNYRFDSLHNLIYNPDYISMTTIRTPKHPWYKYGEHREESLTKRLQRLYSTMGFEKNNISSSLIMMEVGLRLKLETSDHGDIDDIYDSENEDPETPVCPIDIYKKLCELNGYDEMASSHYSI